MDQLSDNPPLVLPEKNYRWAECPREGCGDRKYIIV